MLFVLSASIGAGALGCGDDARRVTWHVRFAPGVEASAASTIVASIARGDCTSSDVVFGPVVLTRGASSAAMPSPLGSGIFSFSADALDATCGIVASGCSAQALPLPDGSDVTVVMLAGPRVPACSADLCHDGRCSEADASVPDASIDAAPPSPDAAGDCPASTIGLYMGGAACSTETQICITDCGSPAEPDCVTACIAADTAACTTCLNQNTVFCSNSMGCQDAWDALACCTVEQCGDPPVAGCDPTASCPSEWVTYGKCAQSVQAECESTLAMCFPSV